MLPIVRRFRIKAIKIQLALCRTEDSQLTREIQEGLLEKAENIAALRRLANLHNRMRMLEYQLENEVDELNP